MALAIGCSVVLALILGIPTLRLRADYLAIVTIAVAEVLRLTFGTSFRKYFHGKDGVTGFTDGFRSLNPFHYDGHGADVQRQRPLGADRRLDRGRARPACWSGC